MGRTPFLKKEETARRWFVVDAEGKTLGRLATSLAMILSGKDKPNWTPHVDNGDFVVVVNAKKVRVSGKKEEDKLYQWHTGYPGGIRKMSLGELREKHPERIVEYAVQGMLPKSKLGKAMIRKLKVYAGADHPHEAQQPETLAL
jgi:large subunit ribosomal protein L13